MKKFYPVIHVKNQSQAVEQASLVFDNGADGLFLISHNCNDQLVIELARTFSFKFPRSFKIGFNLLSSSPLFALEAAKEVGADMVWCDNAGFNSRIITPMATELSELASQWNLEVFAGVAFKYQATESDPKGAASVARELGFIATTSGAATGVAPDLTKIRDMSKEGPLAVASGLTVENISEYLPYLTYFLVATGLSKNSYEFDPVKVSKFSEKIKACI